MAFSAQAKRGDTVTIRTEKKVHGVSKYIYGHVWNEPGSEGAPRKIIISTWNHSMSVDDHARKRWHLNETTGESETITHTVPRTQMIKSYFEAACAIDVHNHLRQDGLGMENAIETSNWWFRLMCTILGMIEVDTFKKFCHFNRHVQVPSHRNFIERLVIMLLTNSKGGAPEPTPVLPRSDRDRRSGPQSSPFLAGPRASVLIIFIHGRSRSKQYWTDGLTAVPLVPTPKYAWTKEDKAVKCV